MIVAKENMIYHAFGLKIKSTIPLPELVASNESLDMAEVEIEIDELNELWLKKGEQGKFIVDHQMVMFQIPETATFLIKDGKKIIVSPIKDSDDNKIRLFILGTCMGALLMQRKVLALHGSAIAIDGKAYAFIGHSGAGKSTLASTFINQGYQLLSDDIIPVIIDKEGCPNVIPTYPQQKLWQESLQKFGFNSSAFSPLFERETKFAIPVHSSYCNDPLPLGGVFEITKTEENHAKIKSIQNLERFHTLYNHTFRQSLIPRLGLMEWHFTESAGIINKIKMYQVHRPSNVFTAPELLEKILKMINEEMN
ncbi:aldolase [Mesobacillus subterraneus]|uniref:aldolase n=1 Tax=Mesobacillus subterraneus TaxID=285983 RepID=UPI00203DE12D|nr:aldolase [Mesobacillus subterraneus]MCM3665215.1 aldolase [Mesobacillus subterraneus]MCM3684228.1 aldolase [Mesobacillus subterraneus]